MYGYFTEKSQKSTFYEVTIDSEPAYQVVQKRKFFLSKVLNPETEEKKAFI